MFLFDQRWLSLCVGKVELFIYMVINFIKIAPFVYRRTRGSFPKLMANATAKNTVTLVTPAVTRWEAVKVQAAVLDLKL